MLPSAIGMVGILKSATFKPSLAAFMKCCVVSYINIMHIVNKIIVIKPVLGLQGPGSEITRKASPPDWLVLPQEYNNPR